VVEYSSTNLIFLEILTRACDQSGFFDQRFQPIRFLGLALSANQLFLTRDFDQSGF
jgi:hypothetical protein